MMALHQGFEPHFDIVRAGADLKPQRVERLTLGVAHCPALGLAWLEIRPPAGAAEFLEYGEGVRSAADFRIDARALAEAHLPGRTMAGDRLLLITSDGVIAHSG